MELNAVKTAGNSRPFAVVMIRDVMSRIGQLVGEAIERRAGRLVAFERREVRRAGSIIALLLAASVFACAATGFAAAAVLSALGERYRVLGASLLAAGFVVLALAAVWLAHRRTRPGQ